MTTSEDRAGGRTGGVAAWVAGYFLLVVAIKVLLVVLYGNPTPYWDQWDAEAAYLYAPWVEGTLGVADLFAPHNEHRIVWTRLLGLLELELNGGLWDPMLQMLVNAVLHGAVLSLLYVLLIAHSPGKAGTRLAWMLLPTLLPFGWENLLAGFQSQFYFLLLFSFLALLGLMRAKLFGPVWWWSFGSAVAAYFSMASGFLCAVAAAVVYLFRWITGERSWHLPTAALLLLIFSVSAYLAIPSLPGHAPLKAASLRDFLVALGRGLAFPYTDHYLLAIVLQLPVLVMAGQLLLGRFRPAHDNRFLVVVVLLVWLYLQAAATAYGRGAGGASPASRYTDTLVLLLPANMVAWEWVLREDRTRWQRWLCRAWMLLVLAGCVAAMLPANRMSRADVLGSMRQRAMAMDVQMQNVKLYLANGDRDFLRQQPFHSIPYPSADRLADLLDAPAVRSVLPDALFVDPARRGAVSAD